VAVAVRVYGFIIQYLKGMNRIHPWVFSLVVKMISAEKLSTNGKNKVTKIAP